MVPGAARGVDAPGRRRDQADGAGRGHSEAARRFPLAGPIHGSILNQIGIEEKMERETSVIAHDLRDTSAPDRNLALELVRVTEAAALAAARWVGRGEKERADQAAVDAMRFTLHAVPMDGVVVIGEGEKDKAPMLYNGEQIGDGSPPEVDVAVDPLEGTRLTAVGQPNAIAVIAVAERGTMFFPGAAVYMDKLVSGAELADVVDIAVSPEENVRRAAEAKKVEPSEIAVVVLDR